MATDTYTLEYVAKIERLQAELAKIPGATDKAALAAAQRLEARMDKASRHAGKAVDSNIGGALKRIAAGSGYGDIAEKLSNLGQGVSALGAGSVLAAAGIGAIAAAGVGLYAATAQTGVLADENARLRREVDDLVYSVGTLMPGAFESGTTALADLVAGMQPAVTGMRALINIGGELTSEFTTQGAITIGLLTSALSGNAEEAQRWAGIYNSSRGYVGAIEAGTAATVEAEKALRILRYNQTQWSGPKIKAEGGAGGAAKAPRVVAAREHTTALQEEIAALQKRDEWAEQALALDQMEAAALAELTVQMGANAEAIEEAGILRASEAMARAQIIDGLRHERDLRIENREIARDAALSEIGQAARVAGAIGKMIEDRAGRSKKAALVGFRIQQGAAAAEVALSTIAAVIEAAPNPIAMALAGAAGGLATAAVFATPPPKFHQGGQADEGVAIVRQGERVLSERGARDYDQGLGDVNRGAAGMSRRGGGPGPRVSFEGRDLDVMLARVVRQHGATRRELDSRRASGAY